MLRRGMGADACTGYAPVCHLVTAYPARSRSVRPWTRFLSVDNVPVDSADDLELYHVGVVSIQFDKVSRKIIMTANSIILLVTYRQSEAEVQPPHFPARELCTKKGGRARTQEWVVVVVVVCFIVLGRSQQIRPSYREPQECFCAWYKFRERWSLTTFSWKRVPLMCREATTLFYLLYFYDACILLRYIRETQDQE